MSRNLKDNILKALIYIASSFTVLILVIIIGYIFIKGIPNINLHFLTSDYENKTTYITSNLSGDTSALINRLGIDVMINDNDELEITKISNNSPLKFAINTKGEIYKVKKGDLITKVSDFDIEKTIKKLKRLNGQNAIIGKDNLTLNEKNKIIRENSILSDLDKDNIISNINQILASSGENVQLKVIRVGGGIVPMFITTIYMIILSLLVAVPIGIFSAIYLNEYAKKGKIIAIIRFAIQNLAGIPSIIYGLFGSVFFVKFCKMQYSILAGALTVSIILLPTIIQTTEETLKTIPKSYRESSLGLGATKFQTIMKVVLPNAISGILVAIILSIGRIVGESAALLLTAGTVAQIPTTLIGNTGSGATLTIKAYTTLMESGNIGESCAIGVVLIVLIAILNLLSKFISNYFMRNKKS